MHRLRLIHKLINRGHWYLLRAKFTNDLYFLVREIGQGRGVPGNIAWKLCCGRGWKEVTETGSRLANILEKDRECLWSWQRNKTTKFDRGTSYEVARLLVSTNDDCQPASCYRWNAITFALIRPTSLLVHRRRPLAAGLSASWIIDKLTDRPNTTAPTRCFGLWDCMWVSFDPRVRTVCGLVTVACGRVQR